MKKVLLTSALALSAIASVSYAATEVPSIPGVTAPTSGTVTKANAANNHNNRFGFAVSPLNKKAFSFAGAKTYPAKPVAGTDGKPLDDSTREFGHNTRFGAWLKTRHWKPPNLWGEMLILLMVLHHPLLIQLLQLSQLIQLSQLLQIQKQFQV